MSKYSFLDDYSEGCHPKILEALNNTNLVQQTAYGNDEYTNQAKDLISKHFNQNDIDIHFVAGGTLANIICIASMLKPYEAIISTSSGHIALREAGAIEATGHKIISVASEDGKLTPENIVEVLKNNSHDRTWQSPSWYIFLIQQKWERFIPKQNYKIYRKFVKQMIYYYLWMEQGWELL